MPIDCTNLVLRPPLATEKVYLVLDQSSHLTGWAIFYNKTLMAYGVYSAVGENDAKRLSNLRHWLIDMINQFHPTVVGLEGIQLQKDRGVTTFQVLAYTLGVLIVTLHEEKLPYKIISSAVWRKHSGVVGRDRPDKKKSMQKIAKNLYGVEALEDEADAIGIGRYLVDKF